MGAAASTTTVSQNYRARLVNVGPKPGQVLRANQIQAVKQLFDRVQEGGSIPYPQFKSEVIGSQLPNNIGICLYQIFSSQKLPQIYLEPSTLQTQDQHFEIDCVMVYEDLLAFYKVITIKSPSESAQVLFHLIKTTTQGMAFDKNAQLIGMRQRPQNANPEFDSEIEPFFTRQEFSIFVRDILQLEVSEIETFYHVINLKLPHLLIVNEMVSLSEFIKMFQYVSDLPCFKWLRHGLQGYKTENLNITDNGDLKNRSLSAMQLEKQKSSVRKETGLEPEEIKCIQDFHNQEIKGKEATQVMRILKILFRDVKNDKLRNKYFINRGAHFIKNYGFEFFTKIAHGICCVIEEDEKVCFLFDVFSEFTPKMNQTAMKDFVDIFQLSAQVFPANASSIDLKQFLDMTEDFDIDFSLYDSSKYLMTAMFGLLPKDNEMARNSILAALKHNPNIETYIYDHLEDPVEEFFVVEQKFWDQWCTAVSFNSEAKFSLKVEHKLTIDNKAYLCEPKHKYRLKNDKEYRSDFTILPKFVYFALSHWYHCDKVIQRNVITYKGLNVAGIRSSSVLTTGIGSAIPGRRDSMRSSKGLGFIRSGQKFYNKEHDEFQEDFIKRVGDITYELEIYPKVIYLAMISNTGEKPFKKLIVNQGIDYNHLKKVLKMDTLPVEELQLSRKKTLMDVMAYAAKVFHFNPKKGRLHINESIMFGPKLIATLEETGITSGTLVYVEYLNDANQWPTESTKDASSDNLQKSQVVKRSAGLQNLGNTCYMNSAIQIIANIRFVHEYFVETRQFQTQINVNSAMGHNGVFASAFANLMNSIWNPLSASVQPKSFKHFLGTIEQQYAGFDQQDSQEYLSFMLDMLNEELNLRVKKPYIANPDSKGRKITELGIECWSNALRRDWSLPFFLFYGQMRSSLTCRVCSTESTTFDIFSNVPLPLPEPTQMTLEIIVHRLPNRAKDVVNGKIIKDGEGNFQLPVVEFNDQESNYYKQLSQGGSVGFGTGQGRQNSTGQSNQKQTRQFTESYNYLTNDQPMRIHIKVDCEIEVKQLLIKIAQIRETNFDSRFVYTELILYSLNKSTHTVKQIFKPDSKVGQHEIFGSELHCQESLNPKGKSQIKQFYLKNKEFKGQHPESSLLSLIHISSKDETGFKMSQPPQQMYDNSSDSSYPHLKQEKQFDKFDILKYQRQIQNLILSNRLIIPPAELLIVVYHRRFHDKDSQLFPGVTPQLISTPMVFSVPSHPSGRRLYDEVWTFAQTLLKGDAKIQKNLARWWERKDWKDFITKAETYKPFVLKAVQANGLSCSRCKWFKRCAGCIIEPCDSPEFIEDLVQSVVLAIEWNSSILENDYNMHANEVVEHATVNLELDQAETHYTNLDDCLQKFHRTEILENEMKCSKCLVNTTHNKKLEIFRPPPVLIIQLKRFRQNGMNVRKLQTAVDFPLQNLEISQYVTDQQYLKSAGLGSRYDLHGIVNHFGSMSYGHYISYLLNCFDNKWYKYDDNSREVVAEANILKESAYILFYIRKDLASKSLAEIYPNIESDIFIGKPVKTRDSKEGFVTKVIEGKGFEVKLKDSETPILLKMRDIEVEELNEFKYDKQHVQHIARQLASGAEGAQHALISEPKSRGEVLCCVSAPKKRMRDHDQVQNSNQKVVALNDEDAKNFEENDSQMGSYDQDESPVHVDSRPVDKGISSARINLRNNTINKPMSANSEHERVQFSSRIERGSNFIDKNKENGREIDYQDGGNVPDLLKKEDGAPNVVFHKKSKRTLVKDVDIKNESRIDLMKSHEGSLYVNARQHM